jgi:hypothetical protein
MAQEMPGSVTSMFGEPDDFAAALREKGFLSLLVTGDGEFRARLTEVNLRHLRLSAAEERVARIAFVTVPADTMLVTLARDRTSAPIWGGIRLAEREIMTLGAGRHLHMRTDGLCRWGALWFPAVELQRYGEALTGAEFVLPVAARLWRLRPATIRHLRHLHWAGIEAIERRPSAFIGPEAAHGLEQQLIEALVECLSKGRGTEAAGATRERQDVAVRFEALLQTRPDRALRIGEICSTLCISLRTLRISCKEQLGMAPADYARRRRTQLLHRI